MGANTFPMLPWVVHAIHYSPRFAVGCHSYRG